MPLLIQIDLPRWSRAVFGQVASFNPAAFKTVVGQFAAGVILLKFQYEAKQNTKHEQTNRH